MLPLSRNSRRFLVVGADFGAVILATLSAVALRFDFEARQFTNPELHLLEYLLLDLLITPLVFTLVGVYRSYWKYTSLDDLARLVRAVGYRTAALIIALYAFGLVGFSRAVIIIDTVLLVVLAGALRLAPRFHAEFFLSRRQGGRAALIVGAGDTGELLLRELRKGPHPEFRPVGFVDDDADKRRLQIHGVPVLGPRSTLERLIREQDVRDVIIAIPSASGEDMRGIFEVCRRTGATFRTVPTLGELQRGAARISQIRLVELEDLLGREVIALDQQMLKDSLRGQRVLVTGAAGSIGRELCRQIAAYGPERLVALDRNENNLFALEAEIREGHPALNFHPTLLDLLDRRGLATLFETHGPNIVFHAAAYKHVPLMEFHPTEAVKNNVVGTHYLAETAHRSGVDRVVYVSTDKAVRPKSVMGATKRLGERLAKSVGGTRTRFMAVRFGNVLGSDGSVIPTFRRQIAAGGPVTVTHPEATRYFMTIPEAVQLVLLAAAMGEGNETFLLRMGQPIRILELARNMIELSGLRPEIDIPIAFTGLRPGENLHEELQGDAEVARPTSNDKIMILSGIDPFQDDEWRDLAHLEDAALEGRVEEVLAGLARLVPDYAAPPSPKTGASPDSRVVALPLRKLRDA
jgi:FlaA1/EpsC-like NDP-sugar epimerase